MHIWQVLFNGSMHTNKQSWFCAGTKYERCFLLQRCPVGCHPGPNRHYSSCVYYLARTQAEMWELFSEVSRSNSDTLAGKPTRCTLDMQCHILINFCFYNYPLDVSVKHPSLLLMDDSEGHVQNVQEVTFKGVLVGLASRCQRSEFASQLIDSLCCLVLTKTFFGVNEAFSLFNLTIP